MKKIFTITTALLILISSALLAGNDGETKETKKQANITGTVLDKTSGENLAGVEIRVENTEIVCYSDLEGDFTINNLKPGSYNIILSYISYNKSFVENINVNVGENKKLTVHLIEQEQ
ncbi:MAG: carboxypeptidase-like regulatory domain-containing protein [Bacteroidales bacterium]|nr:carboxypeptidase-like regulatory domain-containing protein [Bacteroidales bacterium]